MKKLFLLAPIAAVAFLACQQTTLPQTKALGTLELSFDLSISRLHSSILLLAHKTAPCGLFALLAHKRPRPSGACMGSRRQHLAGCSRFLTIYTHLLTP